MPRVVPVVISSVLFFVALISLGSSSTMSYTALRFSVPSIGIITFRPNMNPVTEKFSVCLWIRKINSGPRSPFGYADYGPVGQQLRMTDDGSSIELLGSAISLSSEFTVPLGTWFHYCATWSFRSRSFKSYLNGILVGSGTSPRERRLMAGEEMVLGAASSTGWSAFWGEMSGFNFFAKELTAGEVASMASRGLCADIPEPLLDYRIIKWEEVLKLSRRDTIEEFIVPSCASIAELQQELMKVKRQLSSSEEQLKEIKHKEEEATEESKNVGEFGCTLEKRNLTKWDILHSCPFYNKAFTPQLYQELQTTWDTGNSLS